MSNAKKGQPCTAILWHGPGHQSRAKCHVRGPHSVHKVDMGYGIATWRGRDKYTGYFGELPEARWFKDEKRNT